MQAVKTALIFLFDCSKSMEAKIGEWKRAMQMFLHSIPEGFAFNFFRFGSSYHSLFPTSLLYNTESFAQAKLYLKATQADMGGTKICGALENIFDQKPLPGCFRQLFVLTDGEVTNTDEIKKLVSSNASNTRVFSFGLGDTNSRSLINGIAAAGNGKSEFIKRGEMLEEIVGRHLAGALQPSEVNAFILWEGVENVQRVPTKFPPVFRN